MHLVGERLLADGVSRLGRLARFVVAALLGRLLRVLVLLVDLVPANRLGWREVFEGGGVINGASGKGGVSEGGGGVASSEQKKKKTSSLSSPLDRRLRCGKEAEEARAVA